MHIDVPVDPQNQARVDNQQRLVDAQSNQILQALITATPAQVETWLAANVVDLPSARIVLKALALGLRYVYLMEQKQ